MKRLCLLLCLSAPLSALNLATYNGKSVTANELKEVVDRLGQRGAAIKGNVQQQKSVVENMVVRNLIADTAMKEKIDKSPEFIKMMEGTKRDVMASYYLEQAVKKKVTDKAIVADFNKNKASYATKEDQVRASHILFKTEKTATKKQIDEAKKRGEKILKEALAGKDFAKLASTHSEGPSKSTGGDLNFFTKGRMVKEFSDVAFATKKGKVHPKLVKSQFGFHIIKVTDTIEKGTSNLDSHKDKIKASLTAKYRKEIIEGMKKNAKIKLLDDNFKKIKF